LSLGFVPRIRLPAIVLEIDIEHLLGKSLKLTALRQGIDEYGWDLDLAHCLRAGGRGGRPGDRRR
jgi:hypothetical protein